MQKDYEHTACQDHRLRNSHYYRIEWSKYQFVWIQISLGEWMRRKSMCECECVCEREREREWEWERVLILEDVSLATYRMDNTKEDFTRGLAGQNLLESIRCKWKLRSTSENFTKAQEGQQQTRKQNISAIRIQTKNWSLLPIMTTYLSWC